MIKLTDLLSEIAAHNFEYAYHSGPQKVRAGNIVFDISALGFHVGTIDQAKWVSLGKTKKGSHNKDLPISKFKVFDVVGNLYTTTIDHDMAWEHADILLIELVHEGEMNASDAHEIVETWNDLMADYEKIKELHTLIDIAAKHFGNSNFNAMDRFEEISLSSTVYKNRNKLSQIRELLINEYNIGAIKYKNEVEGNLKDYSICILDKSMIQDV